MKKTVTIVTLSIAIIISANTLLSGCKREEVIVENGEIMRDIEVKPTQHAAYEQYSKRALADYRAVAEQYGTLDDEETLDNENMIAAANEAAAKLFAYACYNERQLDKYVYFSSQSGKTDCGISGSATALRQEYYLRVNENSDSCGYRYHYTIKKVTESSGAISIAKPLFERARTRITDKTNLLYRLEGDNIRQSEEMHKTLNVNLLECDWSVGDDWGKPDIEIKKVEFIEPDDIQSDIISHAGEDNVTIRGNVNILAENAIKTAKIFEGDEDTIILVMTMNTDVLNSDEASLKMLRKGNDSGNCVWQKGEGDDMGLTIVCGLWDNGLFRFYSINESWRGAINGFNGTVDSNTEYYYSYTDRDCDMTAYLKMINEVG